MVKKCCVVCGAEFERKERASKMCSGECAKVRQRQKMREWHSANWPANREKYLARQRTWRELHREENLKKNRLARAAEPDKLRAKRRAWYILNRHTILERSRTRREADSDGFRERRRKYRDNNREKIISWFRLWRADNREKISRQRRARRAADPEKFRVLGRRLYRKRLQEQEAFECLPLFLKLKSINDGENNV